MPPPKVFERELPAESGLYLHVERGGAKSTSSQPKVEIEDNCW
jgi:hypothetical protein